MLAQTGGLFSVILRQTSDWQTASGAVPAPAYGELAELNSRDTAPPECDVLPFFARLSLAAN